MIIEADFLNHWKTKALGNAIGDLEAIRALLKLWGHCQTRRAWEFRLTPAMLAGICDFSGDAARLWSAMLELHWLDKAAEDGWFLIHEWGQKNASLVAKWAAPKKLKADEYPPRGSLAKSKAASSDPSLDGSIDPSSDRAIGLDRIGEDRNPEHTHPARAAPVNLAEAQERADAYSKGNPEMLVIEPAWVAAWHDHRAAVGWVLVRNGMEIHIVDWWADLRSWCRDEKRRMLTPPRSRRGEDGFLGLKKNEGGALPAPNPYEVPPCPEWKKIARRRAQELGLDEAEIEGLNWKDMPGESRLALWADWKKAGGRAA